MSCPPRNRILSLASWLIKGLAVGLAISENLAALDTQRFNLKTSHADFIHSELRLVVEEFGSDANRIPEEFLEKVRRWARLYQTRDRSDMAKVLQTQRELFDKLKQRVQEASLPADLAYITLVESEFKSKARAESNHAGLWQLEPITACRHGLRVNDTLDERLDPIKSTQAACRYLTTLRETLGPGTSLLLTVAAYNLGPSRLQARMKAIKDPHRQKDFWHLYASRQIPALTRTHVARLMAAIIVGRNRERFGFGSRDAWLEGAARTVDSARPVPLRNEASLLP